MLLTFELRSMCGINTILHHVVICLFCNIRKYDGCSAVEKKHAACRNSCVGSIQFALVRGIDKVSSLGMYPFSFGMEYTVH